MAIGHEVSSFEPVSRLERFNSSRLLMRYLRYIHYPALVRKGANTGADVQHVVDHGYAHLAPALKSDMRLSNAHDLIPLLTWKGRIESLDLNGRRLTSGANLRKPLLNLRSLSFLKDFDHIVSVSESTANDLIEFLNLERSQISIIPPALNTMFKPANETEITAFKQRYRLDPTMKWVMLTGREAYKNHPNAFAAIKLLVDSSDHHIGIVRTGLASTEFEHLVQRYGVQDRVRNLFLNYTELPVLYSSVDCLLFPSLYEGFGMPVAEAIACGTPAVISNRGSLPEVANQLAVACDPFDVEGMAGALSNALYDQEHRQQIAQNGPTEMLKYHPKRIGQSLDTLYRRLLN